MNFIVSYVYIDRENYVTITNNASARVSDFVAPVESHQFAIFFLIIRDQTFFSFIPFIELYL
jgi:hypothetical protein